MLAFLALVSVGAIAALVMTQEPTQAGVLAVVAAASVATASIGALLLLRFAAVGRSARARASRFAALRRGIELGAIVGLIATLRLIDGLTPLTALFVVLSFAIAEYVLSAGASRAS
ncbi:MAG: hypothetical protein ACRDGT_08540 [Candidatus Limnocylindria bacterium]